MGSSDLLGIQDAYAIPGHVSFIVGQGGLITAKVSNQWADGEMTLAGGHVSSFQIKNQEDLLWMSPKSAHIIGQAMRGGIPVCWPWFGPHPSEPKSKPMHGFARTALWSMAETRALPDGATLVQMRLNDDENTRALWPHAFELDMEVIFGQMLTVTLIVRNPGSEPFQFTSALHHYFKVADVSQIHVSGLDECDYLDKTEQYARKHQEGDIHFNGWVDRIYLDTTADCVIHDPGFQRKIRISKEGSRTTVVWNPAEKAAIMPDVGLGNEVYFVCVETANAADDIITVAAGGEHRLTAYIASE